MKILLILIVIAIVLKFRNFLMSIPSLFYWLVKDKIKDDKTVFPYYGVQYFVGPQGAGKTMALVEMLERYRKEYPLVKIYTNFGYNHETAPLNNINDLLNPDLYNGEQGTIFAIDEIQNEFASSSSANFPPSVLQTVTQLRKQNILIPCTSQVFSRVSKPLREQAKYVVECKTLFGRYTDTRKYDGIDYADSVDRSDKYKNEHRPCLEHRSFVQTDELRDCYDSYQLIKRLSRDGFSPVKNE